MTHYSISISFPPPANASEIIPDDLCITKFFAESNVLWNNLFDPSILFKTHVLGINHDFITKNKCRGDTPFFFSAHNYIYHLEFWYTLLGAGLIISAFALLCYLLFELSSKYQKIYDSIPNIEDNRHPRKYYSVVSWISNILAYICAVTPCAQVIFFVTQIVFLGSLLIMEGFIAGIKLIADCGIFAYWILQQLIQHYVISSLTFLVIGIILKYGIERRLRIVKNSN